MPDSNLIECIFCAVTEDRIIASNELSFAVFDLFPVNSGHVLIIPKRHVINYFDLTFDEIAAVHELMKSLIDKVNSVEFAIAYKAGINIGSAAGQTILHTQIHWIPRRAGDVHDPTGGIRNVIPGKGNYLRQPPHSKKTTRRN